MCDKEHQCSLEEMFDSQRSFMKLLQEKRGFPAFPVDLSTKEGQKLVKAIAHDTMHELFEAIHLLKDAKDHRKTIVGGFDRDAFLEELSDVLHYFNEICIMTGITHEELFEAYMSKGRTNQARIENGY